MKDNPVQQKSFAFALASITLYKTLVGKNEFVLSRQFLKSATSIGANVEEAIAGFSKRDFTSKMSIASKEARETLYWIKLIGASNWVAFDFESLTKNCEELIRLLTAIVKTSQTETNH